MMHGQKNIKLGLRLYLVILDKACWVPAGHHTY